MNLRIFLCTSDKKMCSTIPKEENLKLSYVISLMDKDSSKTISWKEFEVTVGSPIEAGVQQVHLSITTKPSEMVVMWVTRDPVDTVVKYGLTSGAYSSSMTGTRDTYDVGVFGWSGWIHKVILTNLQPDTTYYYICGNLGGYWSDEFSFVTPPVSIGQKDNQFIFAVMGDMGTTIPMGWAVTDQMVDDSQVTPFNLVIHVGDVAYAGTGSEWEFEEIWDIWCDQVQPLAANIPYMISVGNHEKYYNYTSYRTRFLMPGAQSGGEGNFWWSVNYGNVHFTSMSTEHDYNPGSPQYKWLEQDLQNAYNNRNEQPWIILLGHRPMYNTDVSEWDQHRPGAWLVKVMEPLMKKYKVDLYLSGHMHMYERIYPVYNGTVVETGNVWVNPSATAYVVQATGGVFTDWTYIEPKPAWSAVRNDKWGYGRMTTLNSTHLHYEFMHQESGDCIDEFWIIRQ